MIFDRVAGAITGGDAVVQLTRMEARIFLALARRGTRVAAYDAIMDESHLNESEPTTLRTIYVLVHRMRRRLAAANATMQIMTVLGFGLHLSEPVEIVPTQGDVTLRGDAVGLLRTLLVRCADRPADAVLAEQVRQAAFGD